MRRFTTSGALLVALAALCFAHGCSTKRVGRDPAGAAALAPADELRARELFEDLGCRVCHGDLAEGLEDTAPPLLDLAPYWNVERLSTYILNPEYFRKQNPDFDDRRAFEYDIEMPSYEEASEEERTLLGRWLMTR